jgi:hypothetical protein
LCTRTCICVFVMTGLISRCGTLLLAVGLHRDRSHHSASVGRCSRVRSLRGLGASRDSQPVRSGASVPQGFGRAVGSRELVDWRRRADRTRSGQLGVARERGLRTANPVESAVFGRRSRRSGRRIIQASVTHERVYLERHGGSLRQIGCESRRSRCGTATTSKRDFGGASRSSRMWTVQGNLSWGHRRHRSGVRAASFGSWGGLGSGLCQHRVGFGRAG